jgi:hypothetical protein
MLKPEVSVPVALSTAAMVYGVYSVALPNVAEARTAQADDDDLRAAENVASWAAAAAVGAVTLVTRDPVPFILGGGMIVLMSWLHRHARAVDPTIGRIGVAVDKLTRFTAQDQQVTAAA